MVWLEDKGGQCRHSVKTKCLQTNQMYKWQSYTAGVCVVVVTALIIVEASDACSP